MKIKVACHCGSVFYVPDSLVGQTVRCPSCRQAIQVPEEQSSSGPAAPNTSPAQPPSAHQPTPPPTPDPEAMVDLSDLTSLDQDPMAGSTLQGSTAGRSAIRPKPKKRRRSRDADGSTISDQAITQELDDRMTRLYEVYAGQKMRIGGGGNKRNLLIGLGAAAAIILVGIGIAVQVLRTEYGVSGESVGQMFAGKDSPDTGSATTRQAPVIRTPAHNTGVAWFAAEPGQISGVALSAVQISHDQPERGRYVFTVRVTPASTGSDPRLSMSTSVVLYRADSPEGLFTQADRVAVEGFDATTGSMSFEVFDEVTDAVSAETLYYRLSGFDSSGKRLFDTPPTAVTHVSLPTLADGQVTWSPRSTGSDIPVVRVQMRIDAPGWDQVLLWRQDLQGKFSVRIPDPPRSLPVVLESAVYDPAEFVLDSQGTGHWTMQWRRHALAQYGPEQAEVIGLLPRVRQGRVDYNIMPDASALPLVTRQTTPSGQPQVSFTSADGRLHTLTTDALPTLDTVSATAYHALAHIGWDSTALIAHRDVFDGPVQIAVDRMEPTGRVTRVVTLPADSNGYTDQGLEDGRPVSYEVSLVDALTGSEPLFRAIAWIDGVGLLPVMIPVRLTRETAPVTPAPELDRLYVSLGVDELSYEGTGLPARRLHDRIVTLLEQTPGVAIVDRAGLLGFTQADRGRPLALAGDELIGQPAQLHLRLVDATGPRGETLALWMTDLAAGKVHRLAVGSVGELEQQTDVFLTALRNALASRLPVDLPDNPPPDKAPRLIVVGPIFPVEQMGLYYTADELMEQVARSADQANPDLAVVTRRFWIRDTGQAEHAIDVSSLSDAVLIVGRVWRSDGAMPGVTLHALDADTGRLIGRFTADTLDPSQVRAFGQWCAELRTFGTSQVGVSALLQAEASLVPIHPAWRAALAAEIPDQTASLPTYPGLASDPPGPVIAFGLPVPTSLSGLQQARLRSKNDPLFLLQPCIAPRYPLLFDDWVNAYAQYIKADVKAFLDGFERIRQLQLANQGPLRPRVIVRGESRFTGGSVIPPGASGLRVTPATLNVQTFFPMGAAGQPMVDYRTELSEAFRQRPWAMSHAWRRVPATMADPFLRAELFGVEDGRYQRLVMPDKPAPLAKFVAADLLARLNNREAYNYRRQALERASLALNELVQMGSRQLTDEQKTWATNAVLTLVYVKDPGAIQQLYDSGFRQYYLSIEPEHQNDVMRMLVDRVGPEAWRWAGELTAIDWSTFCWRSVEEAQWAANDQSSPLPEPARLSLRGWIDQPSLSQEENPIVITAFGPVPDAPPN